MPAIASILSKAWFRPKHSGHRYPDLEWLCHGNSIKHAWRAEARDASCHRNGILPLCSGFGSEDPKSASRWLSSWRRRVPMCLACEK